jgi:hypothetical protein
MRRADVAGRGAELASVGSSEIVRPNGSVAMAGRRLTRKSLWSMWEPRRGDTTLGDHTGLILATVATTRRDGRHHGILYPDRLGAVRAERRSHVSSDSSVTRLEPAIRGSPGRIGACFQPAMDWHRALGEISRQSRNVVSPRNRRSSTLFNCDWYALGKWNPSFHSALARAERTFTFRISSGGNNDRGLSVLAGSNAGSYDYTNFCAG